MSKEDLSREAKDIKERITPLLGREVVIANKAFARMQELLDYENAERERLAREVPTYRMEEESSEEEKCGQGCCRRNKKRQE